MFVNGEEQITQRLKHIHLDTNSSMQPKAEVPPMCPKSKLPLLHLTPSGGQKKIEGATPQSKSNPWLLKPPLDIPPTPPPQSKVQHHEFFP